MGYIVVTSADKKSGQCHVVAVDQKTYSVVGDYGMVTEDKIVSFIRGGNGIQPLNFSIDRSGKLAQDCGDFSRFSQKGSAVVLAEIKSKAGRTLGYRLLSCANNVCVNLRLEEILQREKAMGNGEHFLQNGIIRNNTVNCYPLHPFPVMTVEGQTKKPAQKPVKEAPKAAQPPAKATVPATGQRKRPVQLSPAQSKEAELCKQRGVSPKLISNPDLSPEQMRVLWVSKSKGCMAECFADPKYPVEAMKFYADRLHDEQTVEECREMLEHPELTPDQLSELYACVCQGVPYSDLIGLSPTDVSVKREMQVAEYWGDQTYFDSTYLEKAANLAMRLHQGL